MVADGAERQLVLDKLDAFLKECKDYTWATFKERSFGVDHPPLPPIKDKRTICAAGQEPWRKEDKWVEKRVGLHNIRLEVGRGHEVPTPLQDLEVEEEEEQPAKFAHKTREALGRGSVALWGNVKNHRRKPRLHIPALGATVTALSDYTGRLGDCQCYIISNGENLIGDVVVWRCPCQCPWDMELWEALPWPADLEGLAPLDAVLVSREGYGNSRMAGGDYDGDLDMFSFHEDFVEIVRRTETAVRQVPVDQVDGKVKSRLAELEAEEAKKEHELQLLGVTSKRAELQALFDGGQRAAAYLQYSLWLPTPRLRGWACARAERVASLALKKPSPGAWDRFFKASLTAHKAMDVPKHYRATCLVQAMKKVAEEAGITRKVPRSTKLACDGAKGLRLQMPQLRRHNTFEAVAKWLDNLQLGPYGAVWLPEKEIVLGEDAARQVLDILHTRPVNLNFFDRSPVRQPIKEIAYFLAHKLSRTIGGPKKYPEAGGVAIAKAFAHSRMTPVNTTGALYRNTDLL